MSDEDDLIRQVYSAANAASIGDSRQCENHLQRISAIGPERIVSLSFHVMQRVITSADEANRDPQSEAARAGPFLMLVAARLLHGGIARDFEGHWSTRLSGLRAVRQHLQTNVITSPVMHSRWLFAALNEISVAWAVVSKLLLLAHDGGAPGGSETVPSTAVDFTRDEWCGMLQTAVAGAVGDNDDRDQRGQKLAAGVVYLSLLRQCIEECGLTARAALARGLSLDHHDNVREAIFSGALPSFVSAAGDALLSVSSAARSAMGHNSPETAQLLRLTGKVQEVLLSVLSWGPSIFASEFAVDRVPSTIMWPATKYRRVLKRRVLSPGNNTTSSNNSHDNNNLIAAAVASFRLGMDTTHITEIALPAMHLLVQLCSIYLIPTVTIGLSSSPSPPRGGGGGEHGNGGGGDDNDDGPEDWLPAEAAFWVHEALQAVVGTCGYQLFNNFLPDPSRLADNRSSGSRDGNNNNNNNNNDIDPEEAIELGGSLIRQIAVACNRVCMNSLSRAMLCVNDTIGRFPDAVFAPLRDFTTNCIRYAHDLAMVVRNNNSGNNNGGEAQIEEPFTEAIDQLLSAWRDFVKTGLEDLECLTVLSGTKLEACLASCTHTVFDFFVKSRVLFAAENANKNQQRRNNNNNARGLVASAIASHGLDYTLEQISTVGLLGRHDARRSCDILSALLGPRAQEYLGAINNQTAPSFAQTESLWYLFLIMAWVLTDDETSGTDVPLPVVNVAAAVEKEALDAGAFNADDPNFWRELEQRIPVFALMRGTLHFCSQLMSAFPAAKNSIGGNNNNNNNNGGASSAAAQVVSPLLVGALLSLLRRYIHSYVDPDSTRHTEATNHQVFALSFDGGVGIAEPAVNFLSWTLCNYSDSDSTMKEAGELLYALASKENIGPWLMAVSASSSASSGSNSSFEISQTRAAIICAAAVGDTSGPALTTRLSGKRRGALAGCIISACSSDNMVEPAMRFLDYYKNGYSGPIAPNNFANVADTVASISSLLAHAKCVHQLGTIVESAHGYLDEVVRVVTQPATTPPHAQDYDLLANLLELFLNGIEICSFNLPNEVIAFMLQSSVDIINVIGIVLRHSCENVMPRLGPEQRQREEQMHLKMLKAAASLILCAAQYGNMYFGDAFSINPSSNNQQQDQNEKQQAQDRREQIVGTLCMDGLILVLREARGTDLIEVQELSTIVFRVMKEIAQTHTRFFLNVSPEYATILLEATQWSLHSADPQLNQSGFAIIEAIANSPDSSDRMPVLMKRFLHECMTAIVSGAAFEPSVQAALANAVFALAGSLGVDALCDAFMSAVQNTPLLAREGAGEQNKYVRAFAEAVRSDLLQHRSRRNRRLFGPLLRRIVMTVRSANIFS